MRSILLLLLLSLGCNSASDDGSLPKIDPSQPCQIVFGRGSGWHGLDTVKIVADGTVTLYRERYDNLPNARKQFWETASLKLSAESISQIVAAVNESGVLGLDREYHDAGVRDGTQWVFWAQQAGMEKSTYFDNKFPKRIRSFAEALDSILAKNGLAAVEWQRVPDGKVREHEKELWDSIKPSK